MITSFAHKVDGGGDEDELVVANDAFGDHVG